MRSDLTDLATGAALCAIGIYIAAQSAMAYQLGTASRMGPGMFPLGLGVILAVLGLAIALLSFFRSGQVPRPDIVPALTSLGAVLFFAVSIDRIGLAPSCFGLVVISSLSHPKSRPVPVLILALALSVVAVLVFGLGMGLPAPMARWPF